MDWTQVHIFLSFRPFMMIFQNGALQRHLRSLRNHPKNCGENDENSCWILFSARISVNRLLVHHYILVNKFLITTWKTNIFLESNEWFSAWWIFLLDVRKNVKLLDQAENEFFVSNWSTKLISNHCMIHNHTKENVLFIPSPQNFYVM